MERSASCPRVSRQVGGAGRKGSGASASEKAATSLVGGWPRASLRPPISSAARTAAQTCLQGSPRSKNGQEQDAQRVPERAVRETSYSAEPVTIAEMHSALES